jgi:glycogen debranching enzyme GlgX
LTAAVPRIAAGTAPLAAGRPWPLGAHWDGTGVNFALFSAHAERVELCVFSDGGAETCRHVLPECTDQVWHGYLPGGQPGLRYAYRVYGPAGDDAGHRFDPRHLLLDPYARELCGEFSWNAPNDPILGLKSVVVNEAFDWGGDTRPSVPWADTVLYEVHLKGGTRRHPGVPEALRGTYAGLASPAMLGHFRRLGVTALNLLPVQYFLDEERLVRAGRVNYWGYNPLAFFVTEPRYASGLEGRSPADEFRTMVRTLHAAGIEVILDVVFNHTAETDEAGPTLAFRGIDNASYYRLRADDPRLYENFSGCGNTLNLAQPRVLQLVMDALRYWVGEMHVDGFRFDLATSLVRDSAFLAALRQDPLLSRVKLIAEPWDLGPDGYRLGRFPAGWSEWNDRFRDGARAFWLSGEAGADELAQRLAGSSEIFAASGRTPQAGINFITAHDGFTLRDLVSYRRKHNEQNGEDNCDGNDHNHSCNCGIEGEPGSVCQVGEGEEQGDAVSPEVREARRRLQRALLATLLIAQGVPMLQGGDELGRTQAGNNNAYCQDNALTWLDWTSADGGLIDFVAGLVALRRRFPQLRRRDWLSGGPAADGGLPDILWWHPAGRAMRTPDWEAPRAGRLGFQMAAPAAGDGPGESLLCLLNRDAAAIEWRLPSGRWQLLVDTAAEAPFSSAEREGSSAVPGRSLQILVLAAA